MRKDRKAKITPDEFSAGEKANTFREELHPRSPRGRTGGGRFAPKPEPGGSWGRGRSAFQSAYAERASAEAAGASGSALDRAKLHEEAARAHRAAAREARQDVEGQRGPSEAARARRDELLERSAEHLRRAAAHEGHATRLRIRASSEGEPGDTEAPVRGELPDHGPRPAERAPVRTGANGPAVHDLSDMPPEFLYDETQVREGIRDGDVLDLGGGRAAVMVQAWPVMVVGDPVGGLHVLEAGVDWRTFEGGRYFIASEAARRAAEPGDTQGSLVSTLAPPTKEQMEAHVAAARAATEATRTDAGDTSAGHEAAIDAHYRAALGWNRLRQEARGAAERDAARRRMNDHYSMINSHRKLKIRAEDRERAKVPPRFSMAADAAARAAGGKAMDPKDRLYDTGDKVVWANGAEPDRPMTVIDCEKGWAVVRHEQPGVAPHLMQRQVVNVTDIKAFREDLHPRSPHGRGGGRFAPKPGARHVPPAHRQDPRTGLLQDDDGVWRTSGAIADRMLGRGKKPALSDDDKRGLAKWGRDHAAQVAAGNARGAADTLRSIEARGRAIGMTPAEARRVAGVAGDTESPRKKPGPFERTENIPERRARAEEATKEANAATKRALASGKAKDHELAAMAHEAAERHHGGLMSEAGRLAARVHSDTAAQHRRDFQAALERENYERHGTGKPAGKTRVIAGVAHEELDTPASEWRPGQRVAFKEPGPKEDEQLIKVVENRGDRMLIETHVEGFAMDWAPQEVVRASELVAVRKKGQGGK